MSDQVWTIKKVLDWSVSHFHQKGIENARLNAEWLLGETLHMDRVRLYLNFDQIMTREELARFKGMIKKRLERVPLQYILGHYDFMGINLLLNEHVLIPRPETELLVEAALDHFKRKKSEIRILEIGTGSGCIPVSFHHYLKAPVQYRGLEISSQAINLAKRNFEKHSLPDSYQIVHHDFLSSLPEDLRNKKFDLIISNPPYVTGPEWDELQPEVKYHEPKSALVAAHENPLIFYRKITGLKEQLTENGIILVEMNAQLWQEIEQLFTADGFQTDIQPDYSQKKRILSAKSAM